MSVYMCMHFLQHIDVHSRQKEKRSLVCLVIEEQISEARQPCEVYLTDPLKC